MDEIHRGDLSNKGILFKTFNESEIKARLSDPQKADEEVDGLWDIGNYCRIRKARDLEVFSTI